MRGLLSVLFLAMGVLACAFLAGCAGSVPANGPGALNIAQFTLAQGAVGAPYKQLLIASGGQQPYTWTISSGGCAGSGNQTLSGSLPAGLSLTSDGVISGTPTAVETCNFAAQVVDSQSPVPAVDTAPLSITINPPLSLSPASLGNGVVGEAYSATFTAANGVPPYTYTVAAGTPCDNNPQTLCPAPGLTLSTVMSMNGMANAASITGTPSTAGVYTFTVQATDSASPDAESVTAVFTLTVTGRLNGSYAISFNGFANSQAFNLVGSVTAANEMNGTGTITGVVDQDGASPTPSGGTAVTGTYNVPAGTNFGTITFTRTDNGAPYTFSVALSGTTTDSKLILSNPQSWGSGLLKVQSATTLPSTGASYTFGSFGTDAGGNRFAGAGAFALNSSLAVTGGAEDTNDNGTLSGEQCITAGTFSPPDPTTGRGTATLMVAPLGSGGTCGTPTSNSFVYYVASSGELIAVETDSGGPVTLVDIMEQQSAGVSGGLLLCKSGSNCQAAVQLDGTASSGSSTVPEVELGVASFSSCTGTPCAGNFMRSDSLPPYYVDQSVGGTLNSVSYPSGTYSIDATCGPMYSTPCGRVTLNLQGPAHQPVWYLVTTSQAFVVGGDADVLQGSLQPQSPPSTGFSLASFVGSYLGGTITPVLPTVTNEVDVAITPPPMPGQPAFWDLKYETSGPGGPQTGLSLDCTSGMPGCPYVLDPTYGAAFGKFDITDNTNQTITILYIAGGGTVGATGGKAGLVGFNVGLLQSDGTVQPDPNPRLSTYHR